MQSKLSDLVDNLSEIDTKGCKTWMERKISNQNVSLLNLKLIDWIADVKNAREYQRNTKSIKGLIKKFPNIYQFCNGDLNKLVLLLRKEVYPYEYMDSWERFNVTSLPNIMDKDYNHAQKVFEEFGDYHGFYIQTDNYCLQMFLKNLEIRALKYMDLILLISYLHLD